MKMGMFKLRFIAMRAPMPVTAVKLKEEYDSFVLHVSIHTTPVLCNHFFVRIESVANLNRVVLKEHPQFILLFR
jgi:hypothetical protein